MNRLSNDIRSQVVACLCEGNSIRATVRITGVSKKFKVAHYQPFRHAAGGTYPWLSALPAPWILPTHQTPCNHKPQPSTPRRIVPGI